MPDTKISALPAVTTRASTDEFAVNQGGTSKKETLAQIWTAPVFAAGSASAGSTPKLTSGTVMTVPEAGAIEYDGVVPYFTATAGARGVLQERQFSILTADRTLLNQTGVQPAFGTAQDVFTVNASTLYLVDGLYVTTTGATSSALRLAFLLTSATMTYMKIIANGWNAVANTTATASNMTWMDAVGVVSVTAASTTAGKSVQFRGVMAIGTGGTITPQVAFTADPTGTLLMKAGSYVMMTPLGTNAVTTIGNWA